MADSDVREQNQIVQVIMRRPDALAAAAAALAAGMAVIYVSVMNTQGDPPEAWFSGLLLVGALLAGVGALLRPPSSRTALIGAAAVLLPTGVLAFASIGLPILGAGALAALASSRTAEVTAS